MNDLRVRVVEAFPLMYYVYLIRGDKKLYLFGFGGDDLSRLGVKGVVNTAENIANIIGCEVEYCREVIVLEKIGRLK